MKSAIIFQPAVTNLWEVKIESIRNGKKVVLKSRHVPSKGKGGWNGEADEECFRCGRIGGIRALQSRNSAPKGKSVAKREDEETETSLKCAIGDTGVGLSRCCQTMVMMRRRMANPQTKPQK